jgi:hypothetical protein
MRAWRRGKRRHTQDKSPTSSFHVVLLAASIVSAVWPAMRIVIGSNRMKRAANSKLQPGGRVTFVIHAHLTMKPSSEFAGACERYTLTLF